MKCLLITLLLLLLAPALSYAQAKSVAIGKTEKRTFPDVEQPSLHVSPVIYFKPAIIFPNMRDTVHDIVYWRRNFTDQFLEKWSPVGMYPASRIFGFIQDSVYYRSTLHDSYHIFVPQIYKGDVSLYYTRYIQNLGEIRMISIDVNNLDYRNNMIVTGNVPRRYANDFTYFVTFAWDTLKMITVNRKNISWFAKTYLRAYPEAYNEAMMYTPKKSNNAAFFLLPVVAAGTAVLLLANASPYYFIAVGGGALAVYVTVKLTIKPKMLDPEAMIGIIEKCRGK